MLKGCQVHNGPRQTYARAPRAHEAPLPRHAAGIPKLHPKYQDNLRQANAKNVKPGWYQSVHQYQANVIQSTRRTRRMSNNSRIKTIKQFKNESYIQTIKQAKNKTIKQFKMQNNQTIQK